MKYLVVQDWQSTHGNHAGMVHMCKLLIDKYPNEYELFVIEYPKFNESHNGLLKKILNKINQKIYQITFPYKLHNLCKPMFTKLKKRDEVFLLEYLIPLVSQYKLASYIRRNYPYVRIYALSHLTVKLFKKTIIRNNPSVIQKWADPIDKMLTLGTSLSIFFNEMGIKKNKISTGFHYVDNEYYNINKIPIPIYDAQITIIVMGALQRDYALLADVVNQCQDVKWIICKGMKNIDSLFNNNNVKLMGYLPENELRHQMEISDISLNIMEDTVGSNVITTSMAMGLAMIVTDVGSIRDYCNDDNAIFCNNSKDIINAITLLKSDREKLYNMRKNSLEKSKKLSINKVHKWFTNIKNS